MLDAFKWSHLHRVKPLGLNVEQTTCHRLLLQLLANHLISLIHPPGCFFPVVCHFYLGCNLLRAEGNHLYPARNTEVLPDFT